MLEQYDQPLQNRLPEGRSKHRNAVSNISNLSPGIYAYDQRVLTDDQIRTVAQAVRSSPSVWACFSKITDKDWISETLHRDYLAVVRDHLVANNLVMSGPDL